MRPDPEGVHRLDDLRTWSDFVERALARPYPPPGADGPGSGALKGLSSWSLVCQELLDVDLPVERLRACYAELLRRHKTPEDIAAMRRLAWRTAGWLNYCRKAWDRVDLDESDIRFALDWQHEEGQISAEEREHLLAVVARHRG